MTTHHFTMSRKGIKKGAPSRDVQVSLQRTGLKSVTQAVVDEIAAHVIRCESPEPKKQMCDVSNRVDHRFGGV